MGLHSFLFVVVVAATFAADAAHADDCDEVTPIEGQFRTAPLVNVDVIVPCALIDEGLLGADCADAFYVMSPQGIALCRVDLLTWAGDDHVPEVQTDDAEATARTWAGTAAVVVALPPVPPPPLACTLPGAPVRLVGGAADAHGVVDPRPS
jgi:hypothetical protein